MMEEDLYRRDRFPMMFCQGCGIFTIMECLKRALSIASIDMKKVAFVSGIGCSSRVPGYIMADSLHTTHGRALAFATGLKLASPDLKVIVIGGDGDLAAIGGNHFIHACRRNVDLFTICVNNFIYGMTGGQLSPTTPMGYATQTSPYGNEEHPFDISALACAGGANFVARWTVKHKERLIDSMVKGLKKEGFSFIEVLSPCPTEFGRRNDIAGIRENLDWLDGLTFQEDGFEFKSRDIELIVSGGIPIGEFCDRDKTPYKKVTR
jgi:2-oxoglutarate ferredoxin oxidoreductase subunit beta